MLAIAAVALAFLTLLVDDGLGRLILCGAIGLAYFLTMVRIARRHGYKRAWPPG